MTRRLTIAALATLMSLTAFSALAQGHGNDRREEHSRFDDNDRKNVNDWYEKHNKKAPKGFRQQDRLEAEHDARLHDGYVLDQQFRGRIQPLPSGMRFPAPPRNQRYVVIGGHVVLIDKGYQVHDVLRLDLRF